MEHILVFRDRIEKHITISIKNSDDRGSLNNSSSSLGEELA